MIAWPTRGAAAITASWAGTLGWTLASFSGSVGLLPAHSAQSAARLPMVLSPAVFRVRRNEPLCWPIRVRSRAAACPAQ